MNETAPAWDDYFMFLCHMVSVRSVCVRRSVGAIIVSPDNRILATGYNGTPRNLPNCNEGGCPHCNQGQGPCLCCHAEENALLQAARYGISVKNGRLYCTLSPCVQCTRMLINVGITEVVWEYPYKRDFELVRNLFRKAGVIFRCYTLDALLADYMVARAFAPLPEALEKENSKHDNWKMDWTDWTSWVELPHKSRKTEQVELSRPNPFDPEDLPNPSETP